MNRPRVRVVRVSGRRYLVLRWNDPVTGRPKQQSAKTSSPKEADRRAAELEADIRHHRYVEPSRLSWEQFRELHDEQRGPGLSSGAQVSASTVFNHIERILHPKRLDDLTSGKLSQLQSVWRANACRPATIRGYLLHLRAALSWAKSCGYLHEVPEAKLPKAGSGVKHMKGRPLTEDEFQLLLDVAPKVRPRDFRDWQRVLWGLWLSGLRLGEVPQFAWDSTGEIAVQILNDEWFLRIGWEAEKGGFDRLLPCTPDFEQWLRQTPPEKRRGPVLPCRGLHGGKGMTSSAIGCVIRDIGRAAGVVVDQRTGKTASAHDLRRSFGTRWAAVLMPNDLKELMRHADIKTTERYYVGQNASELRKRIWRTSLAESACEMLTTSDT